MPGPSWGLDSSRPVVRRRSVVAYFPVGLWVTALLAVAGGVPAQDSALRAPSVLTGLEVLARQNFAPLKGLRVGLVTNPTGVDHNLRATVDLLASAPGVKLVALFGPEHGVRGDAPAGERVGNARDPRTHVPVFSLYGAARKPTAAMLQGIDALVFDLQ